MYIVEVTDPNAKGAWRKRRLLQQHPSGEAAEAAVRSLRKLGLAVRVFQIEGKHARLIATCPGRLPGPAASNRQPVPARAEAGCSELPA